MIPHFGMFGTRRARPSESHLKRLQHDTVARDGMLYCAKRFNSRRLETQDIFRRELRIELSVENFNVRKFPQMCVHDADRPLPDKKTSFSLGDEGNKVAARRHHTFAEVG